MVHIVALIFLIIGFIFGRQVLKQTGKNYDINLFLAAVIFLALGCNTAAFGISNFRIMLSDIISPFLLGVLVRRYINKSLNKTHNA